MSAALSAGLMGVFACNANLYYESKCVWCLVNYLQKIDGDVTEVHREFEKETG